jgi:2-dehydro-3-deoxy-D-arabinonate dehydratase
MQRDARPRPAAFYHELENLTMQLAKFEANDGQGVKIGVVQGNQIAPLELPGPADRALSRILHAKGETPLPEPSGPAVPLASVRLLPPIDGQEVWGAGVTYLRSKVARQEESE